MSGTDEPEVEASRTIRNASTWLASIDSTDAPGEAIPREPPSAGAPDAAIPHEPPSAKPNTRLGERHGRRDAGYEVSERLRLEVSLLESPSPESSTYAPAHASGRWRSILIVDDEVEIRRYVLRSLQALGLSLPEVYEAADGEEALALLMSTDIDLVIADVIMPRMDGLTLLSRMSEDPGLRNTPVLLISGEMVKDEVLHGIHRHEHTTVLSKPFSARMLGEAVDRLWNERPPP